MRLISGCQFRPSTVVQKLQCLGVWVDYFNLCVLIFLYSLQDLRFFKSDKTSRGILQEGWRDTQDPIMCSYKLVTVKFEVWGLQTRVEQFIHKVRGRFSHTWTVVCSSSDTAVHLSPSAWQSSCLTPCHRMLIVVENAFGCQTPPKMN